MLSLKLDMAKLLPLLSGQTTCSSLINNNKIVVETRCGQSHSRRGDRVQNDMRQIALKSNVLDLLE